MDGHTIRTSGPGWLPELARAYRNREQITLIDDANVGIDPANQSLLDMGLRARLSRQEWTAVVVAVGMSVFGAAMVVLAILDPEPTSKLGLLIASGAVLAWGGGHSAIRILTRHKPPRTRISAAGIEIAWD